MRKVCLMILSILLCTHIWQGSIYANEGYTVSKVLENGTYES